MDNYVLITQIQIFNRKDHVKEIVATYYIFKYWYVAAIIPAKAKVL